MLNVILKMAFSWEQRKLGEIADFYAGNGLSWNDISKNGIHECILYGNLYTDYGMIADTVVYRTNTEIPNPVYSKFGDVLIPASDTTPTGLARASSIEKSGVLLGGDINIVRPKQCINGSCLSLAINANRKQLIKLIKGTTVRHIHNSEIQRIEVALPITICEQEKITSYFKNLDNLITLHQRKYDKLVDIKKALLEKMFPKNNSNIPEIRFKGFTDAWEQRKLLDVAYYKNGKAHENDINENGKYIVVNSKFVSTDGKVRKYSNKQNEPLNKNDIAFVLSDVPNGKAIAKIFVVDKSGKYTLNQRIAGITPHYNINPKYLAITMNRNKYFLQFDDGVKQTNLSLNDMQKYENYYPTKREQDKLGYIFDNIDNLITLHQRKHEKLVKIKQSLLRDMFV